MRDGAALDDGLEAETLAACRGQVGRTIRKIMPREEIQASGPGRSKSLAAR
jgi:hypothetical protein